MCSPGRCQQRLRPRLRPGLLGLSGGRPAQSPRPRPVPPRPLWNFGFVVFVSDAISSFPASGLQRGACRGDSFWGQIGSVVTPQEGDSEQARVKMRTQVWYAELPREDICYFTSKTSDCRVSDLGRSMDKAGGLPVQAPSRPGVASVPKHVPRPHALTSASPLRPLPPTMGPQEPLHPAWP